MTETPMEQIAEAMANIRNFIEEKVDFDDPATARLMDGMTTRIEALNVALEAALSSRAPQAGGEGLRRQNEVQHAVRKLNEPCPFCRQKMVELWRDPREHWLPFQVRCGACFATGPACDCGEESAVPMWLSVQPTPADAPKGDPDIPRDDFMATPMPVEDAPKGDVRGALTALRNRLAMTSDEHWSAEDSRLARDVWLLSTPSQDEGEARVSDEAHVLIAQNIVENNAEHIAVAALNGLVREIAFALSAAHVAGKAARPAEGEALRREREYRAAGYVKHADAVLARIAEGEALRRALGEAAEALERVAEHAPGTPGLHYDTTEKLIESAVGIAKAAAISAHEALSRSPEDDFSADAWGEKS